MSNDNRQTAIRALRELERELSDRVGKLTNTVQTATKALQVANDDLESVQDTISRLGPRPDIKAVIEPVERAAAAVVAAPRRGGRYGKGTLQQGSLAHAVHALLLEGGPLTTNEVGEFLPDQWQGAKPATVSSTLCTLRRKGHIRSEAVRQGQTVRQVWRVEAAPAQA